MAKALCRNGKRTATMFPVSGLHTYFVTSRR